MTESERDELSNSNSFWWYYFPSSSVVLIPRQQSGDVADCHDWVCVWFSWIPWGLLRNQLSLHFTHIRCHSWWGVHNLVKLLFVFCLQKNCEQELKGNLSDFADINGMYTVYPYIVPYSAKLLRYSAKKCFIHSFDGVYFVLLSYIFICTCISNIFNT